MNSHGLVCSHDGAWLLESAAPGATSARAQGCYSGSRILRSNAFSPTSLADEV